jgi:hypothetical protein
MNTNADGDDLSRESHKEHLYKVARFLTKGAGGILAPIGLSTLVSESFDLFVKDPATKRRDRLLMDLMEQVARLTQDGRLSISDLQDNDDVAAVLVRATQAAVRSSGEEKLRALREAALKGMLSAAARVASPAQVIIGLLDRMTEHHVIRLEWEIRERMFYTYGDLDAESERGEAARRNLFYGQPVFSSPEGLASPLQLHSGSGRSVFVEKDDHSAFQLAQADLVAMGLMEPLYRQEEYRDNEDPLLIKSRPVAEVAGYRISQLGVTVCAFISSDEPLLASPGAANVGASQSR